MARHVPDTKGYRGGPDLKRRRAGHRYRTGHSAATQSPGNWLFQRPPSPAAAAGTVDKAAYSFCILEHLHRALPRRDVFAKDGDRWGDPRARLLAGERWIAAQPRVLKALGLAAEPARHLAELASALHAAYVQVAGGLPGNAAVQINDGKLKLGRLGKADEPALMPRFRQMVNNMLPTVDFPELLLEISELTDLADAFTHISGAARPWRTSPRASARCGCPRRATSA